MRHFRLNKLKMWRGIRFFGFVLVLTVILGLDSSFAAPPSLPKSAVSQCREASETKNTKSSAPDYSQVRLISQYPELPNGCEATSLAMVLTAAGCQIDAVTLYEDYMPRQELELTAEGFITGPDPEEFYAGDAESVTDGWYCFEGPVIRAANDYLADCKSQYSAVSVTGLSQAQLEEYVVSGTPVITWVTIDYGTPIYSQAYWILADGREYYPYENLHCVVLTDIDDGWYVIADPMGSWVELPPEIFWNSFEEMGCRAVVIE